MKMIDVRIYLLRDLFYDITRMLFRPECPEFRDLIKKMLTVDPEHFESSAKMHWSTISSKLSIRRMFKL